jgi:hypothetical protein
VGNRTGQLDMAHALTTHFGQSATSTPHFSQITPRCFKTLVFTAQALIVLDRTKDLGAEQAITLRLERTVVNGFRLFDFTK